jgi:hypothetical protein
MNGFIDFNKSRDDIFKGYEQRSYGMFNQYQTNHFSIPNPTHNPAMQNSAMHNPAMHNPTMQNPAIFSSQQSALAPPRPYEHDPKMSKILNNQQADHHVAYDIFANMGSVNSSMESSPDVEAKQLMQPYSENMLITGQQSFNHQFVDPASSQTHNQQFVDPASSQTHDQQFAEPATSQNHSRLPTNEEQDLTISREKRAIRSRVSRANAKANFIELWHVIPSINHMSVKPANTKVLAEGIPSPSLIVSDHACERVDA